MNGVRMDKWLWAARFFKTRALAAKACDLGRVLINNQPVKPAREVRLNERLRVTTEGGMFDIDVLELSEVRGPAAVAQTLYRETDESREARVRLKEERKAMNAIEALPITKPNKRDRRQLSRLRGRG